MAWKKKVIYWYIYIYNSYAELDKEIKNSISHRSKALDELKKYFEHKKQ